MAKAKRPSIEWKAYQSRLPTGEELAKWFTPQTDGLCVIAGAVSGNLELIDFDCQADQFDAWAERVPVNLRSRLVVERNQSGGRHVLYRLQRSRCSSTAAISGRQPVPCECKASAKR